MKNIKKRFNQIIANCPEIIKTTQEYKQNVENIKVEITMKYDEMLKGEKNVFKRVLLQLKKKGDINRAIQKLTSPGNFYVAVESFK